MKNRNYFLVILFLSIAVVLSAVGLFPFSLSSHHYSLGAPVFDSDYAFEIIKKYESFGAKVPGTPEHDRAGDWMVDELKKMNLTIIDQRFQAVTYDQKTIPVRNIIAQWNPNAKIRYMLSAHWDNRPFADNDPTDKTKPVPGVNDGGSGVAVLMSIANAVKDLHEDFGIDFAFWDAEDWGNPHQADTYCLGSQHWAEHPVPSGYTAKFGINYDMVGRTGSVFPVEVYSDRVAHSVNEAMRAAATKLGYLDFFPSDRIGPIVDDHYFVSEKTKIPFIDLIYMTPAGQFAPEWHTRNDTSEFISRDTLKVVGQTTLEMLWVDDRS